MLKCDLLSPNGNIDTIDNLYMNSKRSSISYIIMLLGHDNKIFHYFLLIFVI